MDILNDKIYSKACIIDNKLGRYYMEGNTLNMTWSLKELYDGFNCKKIQRDLNALEASINGLNDYSKINFTNYSNSKTKLEEFINIQNNFYDLYNKLWGFASLTFSADATNSEAQKAMEILQNKHTKIIRTLVNFTKWLKNIDNLEEIIKSSEILKIHEFYLKEVSKSSKYMLGEAEEIILTKMKLTGSNSWEKLQKTLTSNHLVEINIDGVEKKLPLPVIKNMLFEAEGSIRKTAYEAELNSYKTIEEPIAAALNGIKGEVITICNLKGYKSPLHYTLESSRMSEKNLEAMLAAMRESLVNFRKYYLMKARVLGYDGPLAYYDIFAPIGKSEKKYSYEDAKEFIVENFNSFSKSLGDFAKNAFEKRWIDAEPRRGKRGGAFCSNLHSIGESRILCTFTGSFKNISTLAHELGHGYHGHILKDESYLNSKYPMPIAETASLFCETLVRNAAIKKCDEETAFSILDGELTNCGQVIVDIYSRFLFEDELFRRRKDSSLSAKEINDLMLWAQKEAYGDAIDPSTLNPYAWINKPHYYYAERNYYNFPYAFGLLLAKGLYSEYCIRGSSFVEQYDKLLSLTGKSSIEHIGKVMNIDLNDLDFWRSSMEMVNKDIEKYMELADKLGE